MTYASIITSLWSFSSTSWSTFSCHTNKRFICVEKERPIPRINVCNVRVGKPQIHLNFTCLYDAVCAFFSKGAIFNFMSWRRCAHALVRLRLAESHVSGLKYLLQSWQTQREIASRGVLNNIFMVSQPANTDFTSIPSTCRYESQVKKTCHGSVIRHILMKCQHGTCDTYKCGHLQTLNCHKLYSGEWAEWRYSYCMWYISSLRRRCNYPSHLIYCDKVMFLLHCLLLDRWQYVMLRSGSYSHTHTATTNKKKPEEVFFFFSQ